MSSIQTLRSSSQKQNPFVIRATRVKKEAEKEDENGLLYFYITIFLDDNGNTGKSFLAYDDIDYVEYTLHESFPDRFRVSKARDKKFEIRIWTYGFFISKAKIFTRWGQVLDIRGKVEFYVTPAEKANNKGELEW